MRASLDSNVLVYAALEPQSDKGRRAADVIKRAAVRGILAAQAQLEFVAVVRRRAPDLTGRALAQVDAWASVFETAPTTAAVVRDALEFVRDHRLQVWDAVICAAAAAAGADVLFSEDMHDGLTLSDMRVVNPFARSEGELGEILVP